MGWEPTESICCQTRPGNPLDLLPPRQRAVIAILASGLDATTTAKVLGISRETLYQDRRSAWEMLRPVVPGAIARAYDNNRQPWAARRRAGGGDEDGEG